MYENKGNEKLMVIDLPPVIRGLLNYRSIQNPDVSGIDPDENRLTGMSIEKECDLAEEIGTKLTKGSTDNPYWIKIASRDFCVIGECAIYDMIVNKKITQDEGNKLIDALPTVASNVADEAFGQDVWFYKEMPDEPNVVYLLPVIEGLSTYRENLESKYSDIDFEENSLCGVPVEMECTLAKEIGLALDTRPRDDYQWFKLTSREFYETGGDVINGMIEKKKITPDEGNKLRNSVSPIAHNVTDEEFGRDVSRYEKIARILQTVSEDDFNQLKV